MLPDTPIPRCLVENDDVNIENLIRECLNGKSDAEIRALAQKYSKKGFSREDTDFFLYLQDSFQKIFSIYSLLRRVSCERAEKAV